MKRERHFLFIAAMVISSVLWSCISWATDAGSRQQTAANAINAFGLELYQKLKNQDPNLFFSPYSVSVAISMTCAAAGGKTLDQITRALHTEVDDECLSLELGSLDQDLGDSDRDGAVELKLANQLWLQKGNDFNPDYLKFMKSSYGASPNELDFKSDPASARSVINKWVARETRDKITELITEGAIDRQTQFVLTNAVYFKGKWSSEFRKDFTKDAPFTSLGGERSLVPLMHRTARFGYLPGDGFQALEMPYKDTRLSMVVLLPAESASLKDFEEKVTSEGLSQWIGQLKETQVSVFFPKFKRDTPVYSLVSVLESMGIKDAFSRGADFSRMSPATNLHVNAVLHKAFVDVNEQGTEAAASTVVAQRHSSKKPPIPIFKADRPFVFLIRHKPSNSILFLGRFAKP
jgi:serpin B